MYLIGTVTFEPDTVTVPVVGVKKNSVGLTLKEYTPFDRRKVIVV